MEISRLSPFKDILDLRVKKKPISKPERFLYFQKNFQIVFHKKIPIIVAAFLNIFKIPIVKPKKFYLIF